MGSRGSRIDELGDVRGQRQRERADRFRSRRDVRRNQSAAMSSSGGAVSCVLVLWQRPWREVLAAERGGKGGR